MTHSRHMVISVGMVLCIALSVPPALSHWSISHFCPREMVSFCSKHCFKVAKSRYICTICVCLSVCACPHICVLCHCVYHIHMYVVCICVFVCLSVSVCVCMHACVYVMSPCASVHAYVCSVCMHLRLCVCLCLCVCVCLCVCMHVLLVCMCVSVYVCAYVSVCTLYFL